MTRIEEFDVGDRSQLDVAFGAGRVEVIAASPGRLRVSIDARDPDAFDVTRIGDTVTVREGSRRRSRIHRAHILVEAPPGCDLTAQVGSADVIVRGSAGVVAVRSASGDLDVESASRVEFDTGSGDVRVGVVTDDARLSTASGDVTIESVTGSLDACTASGCVTARRVAGSVEIGTASGDVRLEQVAGDALAIKTLSGDIRLGLPAGIRVEPDIATLSGSVTLPTAAPASDAGPRRPVRVRLSSMSGDIRIDRSS
jgi:hypothetical protein